MPTGRIKRRIEARISEREVTAELDIARCAVGTCYLAEAGVLGCAAGGIWVGVVGSVGKVEGIYLKARRHALTNLYRLRQRGVRVPVAGAEHLTNSGVTELILRWGFEAGRAKA